MKKLSMLIAMLLVAIGLSAGWSTTASADSTPAVTTWEYHHVYLTDSKRRVERVFDAHGRWVYEVYDGRGVGKMVKEYKGDDGTYITITYTHPPLHGRWRMISSKRG